MALSAMANIASGLNGLSTIEAMDETERSSDQHDLLMKAYATNKWLGQMAGFGASNLPRLAKS